TKDGSVCVCISEDEIVAWHTKTQKLARKVTINIRREKAKRRRQGYGSIFNKEEYSRRKGHREEEEGEGEREEEEEEEEEILSPLTCVKMVDEGNRMCVCGCENGDVLLVDLASAEIVEICEGHTASVTGLSVVEGCIYSSGEDKRIYEWKLELTSEGEFSEGNDEGEEEEQQQKQNKKQRGGITGHSLSTLSDTLSLALHRELGVEDSCTCIHASPSYVMVGFADSSLRVYHRDSFRHFVTLYGHSLPINSVAVSEDEYVIATGSVDKTIKIWNLPFGDCKKTMKHHSKPITSIVFLPFTHYLFSSSRDCSLCMWDCDKCCLVTEVLGHNEPVNSLSISSGGRWLYSVGKGMCVRIWRRSEEMVFVQHEEEERMRVQLDREEREERVKRMRGEVRKLAQAMLEDIKDLEGLDGDEEEEEREGGRGGGGRGEGISLSSAITQHLHTTHTVEMDVESGEKERKEGEALLYSLELATKERERYEEFIKANGMTVAFSPHISSKEAKEKKKEDDVKEKEEREEEEEEEEREEAEKEVFKPSPLLLNLPPHLYLLRILRNRISPASLLSLVTSLPQVHTFSLILFLEQCVREHIDVEFCCSIISVIISTNMRSLVSYSSKTEKQLEQLHECVKICSEWKKEVGLCVSGARTAVSLWKDEDNCEWVSSIEDAGGKRRALLE
ncbi:hypothetical protein ADUPG1_012080, partial [Aduncisulcus paluster]